MKQRRNAEVVPVRVLPRAVTGQPELPDHLTFMVNGVPVQFDWPEQTVDWWDSWAMSPLSTEFGVTDWEFLLDTALLHAAYWRGNLSVAGELRLRVAKFGATPEDRLRLKIQFEVADAAGARGQRRRTAERTSRAVEKVDPRQGLAG